MQYYTTKTKRDDLYMSEHIVSDRLSGAIHNFKWVKIVQIWQN